MDETQNLLQAASQAYFNEGAVILPDVVFDALSEDNASVGAVPLEDKVKLPIRMYSLEKSYEGVPDRLVSYSLVETIKLDGAAVILEYKQGLFHKAYTRGDGEYGRDITHHIGYLTTIGKIPFTVASDISYVTGEVVTKSIANARNFVSGALNTKLPEFHKLAKLVFAAYDFWSELDFNEVLGKGGSSSYEEDQNLLKLNGFKTVLYSDWEGFPTDGKVLRVNDNDIYRNLGYTSKYPKGAIALKERKAGYITTLVDVIWQVGRSGVVTPVAILDPVNVDGAIVQRASLHNKKFIEALGISLGDQVEVVRAGDIIPQIVRKIT